MSLGAYPLNEFNTVHYNPDFFKQPLATKALPKILYMTTSAQIYTGLNNYTIGSITLTPGTYLVNVQYAFQGVWSAIGSVTNCALCISSNQSISTGIATPTFFYCQGSALQTSVTGTTYNFGINGSGILTITNTTPIYLIAFCYYTGTAVIQNQTGNLGSVSFIKL